MEAVPFWVEAFGKRAVQTDTTLFTMMVLPKNPSKVLFVHSLKKKLFNLEVLDAGVLCSNFGFCDLLCIDPKLRNLWDLREQIIMILMDF